MSPPLLGFVASLTLIVPLPEATVPNWIVLVMPWYTGSVTSAGVAPLAATRSAVEPPNVHVAKTGAVNDAVGLGLGLAAEVLAAGVGVAPLPDEPGVKGVDTLLPTQPASIASRGNTVADASNLLLLDTMKASLEDRSSTPWHRPEGRPSVLNTAENFTIGAATALVIAFGARYARTLTRTGALCAFLVGTATFGGLGIPGATVLLTFFLSSIALSRLGKSRKKLLVDVGKQGERDGLQVLANGGIAALCALAALTGNAHWAAAFAGAFAAATADTWGTEIGTLAGAQPRSLFTGKPIACGLSGGVTHIGTLAEIAGALLIALAATAVGIRGFLAIAAGGCCGAFLDSLLGATVQSLRWCPSCRRACETNPHVCGTGTISNRGFAWMTNDFVNFAATLCGAAVAYFLAG
jgi:uncharacterized protein (TIGR00297 family)